MTHDGSGSVIIEGHGGGITREGETERGGSFEPLDPDRPREGFGG